MAEDSKPGQQVDGGQARIFPCEGCGADLKFSIGQQLLKCPYCGFEKELEFAEDASVEEQDFGKMVARMKRVHEKDRHDESGQKEIRCDSCGGSVTFQGPLTSSGCPWCDSPIQLDNVHDAEHRVPADGVLPFLVERDRAQKNLADWVKSRWFAPNDFLERGVNGKFNGVYMPYWTFDSMTFTRYSGKRGDYYWEETGSGDNKQRVRKTRWRSRSGQFQRFFDDLLVLASKGLPKKVMRKLEPWPLEHCVPFTQEALAGFFARTYEIELDAGFSEARQIMKDRLEADVKNRIGGDTQRISSMKTQHNTITFKHLLLPVWLLAYRYNEKAFQICVNAATGEVQGERPYSFAKIALLILAIAVVVGGVALLNR
jgi:DNA-directed RNA polymerase subunit RPC12/RpoP